MKGVPHSRKSNQLCHNLTLGSAILQRVSSASVTVDKKIVSSIGRGVLVLAAVGPDDTTKDAETLAAKVLKLKMWPNDAGQNVCCHSIDLTFCKY